MCQSANDAAAAIAKTSPTKTGFYASRFGIAAYLVPFIFVYSPALLLESEIQDILLVAAKSLLGLSFLFIALSGFLFRSLGWGEAHPDSSRCHRLVDATYQ